ncbi:MULTISPECIES: phage portal protein [Pontibacillus]|uniref:Phage portal protein n=1 Tax=Pontibacillus chungwhensis TaxID=265426 RepID=A0ABY8V627_9BACI|nr:MULTISPECIES: phage portal protein [Pontibacillus]MCD5326137.1 phage portal protein [Pontibacillus sp. HN14]WIG00305.1 phage portal protein [Pontibacillus chungwhensis]
MSRSFVVTDRGEWVTKSVLDDYRVDRSKIVHDRFENEYGNMGAIEPTYPPELTRELLSKNIYHATCVKTKATDVSSYGFTLKEIDAGNDEDITKMESRRKEAEEYLESLNIGEVIKNAEIDFGAVGFGAMEVILDEDNKVIDFNHVPSYTVRAHRDRDKYVQMVANKVIYFGDWNTNYPSMDLDFQTGKWDYSNRFKGEEFRKANRIVMFSNYSPNDSVYGEPDIAGAIGSITSAVLNEKYRLSFYESFGKPDMLITVSGNYEDEIEGKDGKKYSLVNELEKEFRDKKGTQAGSMVIGIGGTDVEINVTPLVTDTKEQDFTLTREADRNDILAAHRVSPYRLGIAEIGNLGGSTVEESLANYRDGVVRPRQKQYEGLLNSFLKSAGFDFKVKLNTFERDDDKADLEIGKELVKSGAISPLELRNRFANKFNLSDVSEDYVEDLNAFYIEGKLISSSVVRKGK